MSLVDTAFGCEIDCPWCDKHFCGELEQVEIAFKEHVVERHAGEAELSMRDRGDQYGSLDEFLSEEVIPEAMH